MRQKSMTIKKKVKFLTDPHPEFASLVGAGANNTPLTVVKSDEIETETPMSKNLKSGNAGIAAFVFTGEKFKTEDQVKAWLDKGGYTDYEVVKTADKDEFTVKGDNITDAKPIEVEDGVVSFVGEKLDEPKSEESAPKAEVVSVEGQKVDEPKTGAGRVVKAEDALAKAIKDSTLTQEEWDSLKQPTRDGLIAKATEALAADPAYQGEMVQPVATDAAKGETQAPKSVIVAKADIWDAVTIAGIIGSLKYLSSDIAFDAALDGTTTDLPTKIKAWAAQGIPLLQQATGEAIADISEDLSEGGADADDAGAILVVESDKANEATGESQKTAEAAPAADAGKTTAEKADISAQPNQVLDAIKALTDTVGALAKTITEVKATTEQNAQKQDKLAERLSAVESTGQSRKSADVDEVATAPTTAKPANKTTEISADVRKRNSAELLGLRT